jgi:Cu-Zn family superoxide dismutase
MRKLLFTLLGGFFLFSACQQDVEEEVMMHIEPSFDQAIAVMTPTEGNEVEGVVTFTKTADGMLVEAEISGLTPGDHGFHVHQFGDIRKSDGTSAGGHFNPEEHEHAGPEDDMRHVGDLGNITADENGNATYKRVDPNLNFYGESNILGRGVIIHAGEDDLTSQPTGAAGAREAMGVIGVANNEL